MRLTLVAAHRVRPAFQAGRTLWAAVLLAMAPAIAAAQGSSTAPVRYSSLDNQVVATYSHDGIPDSAFAGAMITVARQAALILTGSTTASMAPGQRRVFTHLLTNRGTTDDLVSLVATTSAGWTVALYRDVDGNGQLSAIDTPISGPVSLAVGANIPLLAVLDVPASAPLGATGSVSVAATSGADARAAVTATDNVTIIARPLPDLRLTKAVDRATGTLGDTLHYTITFANVGDGDARNVSIVDTLPAGLRLAAGSLRLNGGALTDAADTDAGAADTLPDGRAVVRLTVGALVSQASGTLQLSGVVVSLSNPVITNVAVLAAGDTTRTFVRSAADAAVTRVSLASLGLADRLVGTPILMAGAQVHLRLTYSNTAGVDAHNAVLTDTLPALLSVETSDGGIVSSTGGATPQAIVTWALGTLATGATGVHDIYLRVGATPAAGTVSDRASVTADNAATQFAGVNASVALFTPADLRITKTAGVLEAAIGDAVPYTVVVHNAGIATLSGVVVHDRLPDGMRYSPASLSGADSATEIGQDLSLYVGAPLAAGASLSIRYAAVIATPAAGAALENVAVAEAESGLVRSDTARAIVTQRRSLAMRERTMIGKVWLDRNDDGVQQGGEEGVAGVQVWDANGDFTVTDKEGRFSFRNVQTGTHALRLDPAGIPRNFVLPSRSDEVIVVNADGWSLPSTSIRLVPRANAAQPACGCASAAITPSSLKLASATSTAPSPAVAPARIAPPVVAPLVSAAGRAAVVRRELVDGAGLRIASPADGTVLATPRFFANVRGAPGMEVGLFDGTTRLTTGALRGDGAQDFVNVELPAGPHHLRVAPLDAAAGTIGDSIMVHVSGAPSRFVATTEVPVLHRDAVEPVLARVQVLDRWNVPVANLPMITVAVTGATVAARDEDASSVGLQLRADAAGWVTVPLKAGYRIGEGELRLSAADARLTVPLRVFASVRPLAVTGIGQLGLGAAPGTFGAMTVQGAIAGNTSLVVSYDSRRSAGSDFFDRGFDPYGDEQYPTVGDNATSGGLAPTTKAISARVEHGMDWLAAGDVQTVDFGRSGELGAYRRSLTGVSARIGTGALVWHGFGSMTQQSLERSQLRGDGSTGPYLVGSAIRAGTDVIAIEVRARENGARVVSRQPLVRIADYEIDYANGAVLLRLPVPSTDSYGNPVYVVATVERTSGGASHFVGGLRADVDAKRALHLGSRFLDSLTVGLSGVRDESGVAATDAGAPPSASTLLNADLQLRHGGLTVGMGVLRSQAADSTGVAGSATVRWTLPGDALVLDGHWMSVGQGMGSTDPRLASALVQTDIGLTGKLSATSSLRLHRVESRFFQYGVTRGTTSLGAEQVVRGHKLKQELSLLDENGGTGMLSSALTARLSTSLSSTVETWIDGTRSLVAPLPGMAGSGRPDQIGTGVTVQLPASLKLEASHRIMRTPGDSLTYGVTSAQLRAESAFGGQLWTGFEESTTGLHDEVRAGHSALLGWNQKLGLGAGWQLTSLYERRIGLSRAAIAEPERALPFVQAERDRWSAGLGLGWMPGGDAARVTMNAEMQSGQGIRSSRFQLSGDAALSAGLAVLAVNDWSGRSDASVRGGQESRQDRSLLGLAMRPVTSNHLNVLSKLEWRRTTNPVGAALVTSASRDLRLIASSDVVWAPMRGTELSTRYALRATTSDVAGDSAQRLHVADHFGGARIDQRLVGALHVRADGRLLMETESRTALWNVAPSVLYDVQGRLMLEAGYRFGALRDPDFAAVGGAGAFATVGFRFTEGSLANPASFWRERIANDR